MYELPCHLSVKRTKRQKNRQRKPESRAIKLHWRRSTKSGSGKKSNSTPTTTTNNNNKLNEYKTKRREKKNMKSTEDAIRIREAGKMIRKKVSTKIKEKCEMNSFRTKRQNKEMR